MNALFLQGLSQQSYKKKKKKSLSSVMCNMLPAQENIYLRRIKHQENSRWERTETSCHKVVFSLTESTHHLSWFHLTSCKCIVTLQWQQSLKIYIYIFPLRMYKFSCDAGRCHEFSDISLHRMLNMVSCMWISFYANKTLNLLLIF